MIIEKLPTYINEFIITKRKERRIGQSMLGMKAGVSLQTVWNYENCSSNRLHMSTFVKLVYAMDLTLSDFESWIEERDKKITLTRSI